VTELGGGRPGEASRIALCIDLGPDGRIRRLDIVLASRKLTAIAADAEATRR
jgi:hypothetical protein